MRQAPAGHSRVAPSSGRMCYTFYHSTDRGQITVFISGSIDTNNVPVIVSWVQNMDKGTFADYDTSTVHKIIFLIAG